MIEIWVEVEFSSRDFSRVDVDSGTWFLGVFRRIRKVLGKDLHVFNIDEDVRLQVR